MIALVTGGTRGIGLACVRALKAVGHSVAVMGRSPDAPDDCDLYIRADLLNKEDRKYIIDMVVMGLGGIDIIVNNAGCQHHAPVTTYWLSMWRDQIELMLTAPFDLSQQAARYMLSRNGGHIVNILSTSAFQGARNISGYVAAKHGLLGLTRAMAIELAPKIHVNAIAPGLVETDMTREYISDERRALLESITPAGRFGEPDEVADALMYLVNSTYVYGQTIVVDGGWMAKNG